ncbi:MAG: N-6 DNA methylase [Candidatus Methanoperedens sp.]
MNEKEIIFLNKKEKNEVGNLNNSEPNRTKKKKGSSPPKEKSEARARSYTKNELNRLGWNIKHPSHKGQLLEEQEAKNFDDRFKELLGLERPDFLIYNDNKPNIVIETKNEKEKIDEAIQEAKEYAEKLSAKYFDVRVAIGIAGNEDDGVLVRNYYRKDDKKWYEIMGNGQCLSQILTLEQFNQVIINKNPTTDVKIPTETEFFEVAEKINDIFYEADVSPEDRGIYLGGIILALKEGDIDIKPNIIIKQINANIESALDRYGKPKLKDILKIKSETEKLKNKLPLIFHQLDRLNIKSLMFADGDILGKFFETFLRYGNNISKLGVVFTPRHITKFMCDLVDVNSTDVVYDLTCGTGGFLVSAFHTMKSQVSNNSEALNKIKIEQLIGVDSENSGRIPALAVVNMIFRGDGRSNIYHENCFTFRFKGKDSKFATKVLMNPPHAKKTEPEIKFLEYGLKALKDGHLLGAIMPYSVFSQKTLKKWRQNLLKEHTLLATITMPSDLFYPISQTVVIVLMKAHIPHFGKIWFCRIENDGYKIKRNKRVECEGEQLSKGLSMYKAKDLNLGIEEKKGFACYKELDPNDDLVELVPEAYLDSPDRTKEEIQEQVEQGTKNSSFKRMASKRRPINNFI